MDWNKQVKNAIFKEPLINAQVLESLFNEVPSFIEGVTIISFFMINKSIESSDKGKFTEGLTFAELAENSLITLSNNKEIRQEQDRLDILTARAISAQIKAHLGLGNVELFKQSVIKLFETIVLNENIMAFPELRRKTEIDLSKAQKTNIKKIDPLYTYISLYKIIPYEVLSSEYPDISKYLLHPKLLEN